MLSMMHPLRKYRHEAGVTLDQLAKRVGLNKSTLSKIESGASFPRMAVIQRLIEATGGAVDANAFLPSDTPSPAAPAGEHAAA